MRALPAFIAQGLTAGALLLAATSPVDRELRSDLSGGYSNVASLLARTGDLATALKDYMNNPVVTVIVVEATAPTAYVVGEVNHPGPVTLQPNMTVLQALAVAGGLKDFADAKNIRILRKSVTGQSTVPFNYRDAIRGTGSNSVLLQPGDTVVVPD